MSWMNKLAGGLLGLVALAATLALLSGFAVPLGDHIFAWVKAENNALVVLVLFLIAGGGLGGAIWAGSGDKTGEKS